MSGYFNNALGYAANTVVGSDARIGSAMNVPGGSVDAPNTLRVECEYTGIQGATAMPNPKLNGVALLASPDDCNNMRCIYKFEIQRTGNTTGRVTGTVYRSGIPSDGTLVLEPRSISGLSWASQQAVEMFGASNQLGGIQLQYAGESH